MVALVCACPSCLCYIYIYIAPCQLNWVLLGTFMVKVLQICMLGISTNRMMKKWVYKCVYNGLCRVLGYIFLILK